MKTIKIMCILASVLMLTVSCENNAIELKSGSSAVLNYEDQYQIDAVSALPLTYTTQNPFNAQVSASGLVEAGHVGETYVTIDNTKESMDVRIVVEPKYNLYPTPSLDWGTSKSSIIAKYGSPDVEDANGVGYKNYSFAAPICIFLFDKTGGLMGVGVYVKTQYSSALTYFLIERYQVISVDGSSDRIASFVDGLSKETIKSFVSISLENLSHSRVTYIEANLSSRTKSPDTDPLQSQFEEILAKIGM